MYNSIINFITKKHQCPCTTQASKQTHLLKSTSFLYKVLLTLHSFQEDPVFYGGVEIIHILQRMNEKYSLDGDGESQVMTAIARGVSLGYIWKKPGCKYKILVSSAAIQKTPCNSRSRKRIINEINSIFTREIPDVKCVKTNLSERGSEKRKNPKCKESSSSWISLTKSKKTDALAICPCEPTKKKLKTDLEESTSCSRKAPEPHRSRKRRKKKYEKNNKKRKHTGSSLCDSRNALKKSKLLKRKRSKKESCVCDKNSKNKQNIKE